MSIEKRLLLSEDERREKICKPKQLKHKREEKIIHED
jgi:hypothetical protein